MKLRTGFVFLIAAAVVAAGCGKDDGDSKKSDSKKDTKATSAAQKIVEQKEKNVADAEKAFKAKSGDVNLCRDLAMKYIALASPESTGDPKKAPAQPKDREKNLAKSVSTLEDCTKIDGRNRDVQQMLASAYMATGKYDKASPLLGKLAASAKADEKANAYYAWGLAASNAQDLDGAINAWTKFTQLAPAKDPRIAQVKQSIKALQAAKKPATAAKSTAAATTTTSSDDSAKADDSGSDSSSDASDDKGNDN